MAELTVVPKRKTNWIWLVLALLVLAALLYFFVLRKEVAPNQTGAPAPAATTAPANTPNP